MTLSRVIDTFKRIKLRTTKKDVPPVPEAVWKDPVYFAAFGLGSGAMPFAPGTFGTLMAIPFYLLLQSLPLTAYLVFVALFIGFSSWVSERCSREMQYHDHPGMCIDEFAGFFVTMINAPAGCGWVVTGFLLFRLFDIWKPWPIHLLDEKIHGGFGMILDDVVAGVFACLIIQCLRYVI
jgi:phosphatidylglycerophosphatase A